MPSTLIIHTDFYIRSNRQRVFACLGAIQPPVVFAVYVPCQVSVCSAQEYRKPLFVFVGKYDVCFQNAVCAERVIIALKGRCYFNDSTLRGISRGIGEVQFDSLRHRFLGFNLSRKIRAAEAEALRRNISAVLVCGIDGDRIASGCERLHGQGDLAACIQLEFQPVALAAENACYAVQRAFGGKFQVYLFPCRLLKCRLKGGFGLHQHKGEGLIRYFCRALARFIVKRDIFDGGVYPFRIERQDNRCRLTVPVKHGFVSEISADYTYLHSGKAAAACRIEFQLDGIAFHFGECRGQRESIFLTAVRGDGIRRRDIVDIAVFLRIPLYNSAERHAAAADKESTFAVLHQVAVLVGTAVTAVRQEQDDVLRHFEAHDFIKGDRRHDLVDAFPYIKVAALVNLSAVQQQGERICSFGKVAEGVEVCFGFRIHGKREC